MIPDPVQWVKDPALPWCKPAPIAPIRPQPGNLHVLWCSPKKTKKEKKEKKEKKGRKEGRKEGRKKERKNRIVLVPQKPPGRL